MHPICMTQFIAVFYFKNEVMQPDNVHEKKKNHRPPSSASGCRNSRSVALKLLCNSFGLTVPCHFQMAIMAVN